jgi:hypothetical protein
MRDCWNSPHSFFPASLYEPAVRWVGREEPKNHPDLHHEPVTSLGGTKMRLGEKDKEGQGHPGEQTDFKGENGEVSDFTAAMSPCLGESLRIGV